MMRLSTTASLVVVVVGTLMPCTTALYSRQEWENLLPGCEQADNLFEAAQCIVKNSPTTCFSRSTAQDLYQCFTNDFEWNGWGEAMAKHTGVMRDVMDTALDCFDPYHDCLVDRIETALDALPACVQESTTALADCFMDNVGTCFASCSDTVWESPYADLNIFDLFTCPGIERNLLQPMCDIVACCPQCVPPLEEVAECVVNDVLQFWRTCDFTCAKPPPNRRGREVRAVNVEASPRTAASTNTAQVYEACRTRTPGLLETMEPPSVTLAARTNYFDCVMEESLALLLYETVETEAPTPCPTASPTDAPTAAADEDEESTTSNSTEQDPTTTDTTVQLSANNAPSAATATTVGSVATGWMLLMVAIWA